MDKEYVKVGVGVMIFKDGKILAGIRKGSHGEGEYAFTGGHLEHMESFIECAKRETMEEAGIKIKNINFLCISNECDYPPRHGVLIGLTAEWESGEPQILEPDKRLNWGWYDIDDFPKPIFKPAEVMINAYKTDKIFYDKE